MNPAFDGRALWLYGSHGEGRFEQLENGTWIEVNATGTFRYHEIGRTPEYVELYDQDRDVWVRLTDRRLFSRGGSGGRWDVGYPGRWMSPGP
jgi:hypothetical protein